MSLEVTAKVVFTAELLLRAPALLLPFVQEQKQCTGLFNVGQILFRLLRLSAHKTEN